jgi:hypothetical protein
MAKNFLTIAVTPMCDIALALPFGWGVGEISRLALPFTAALPIAA